MDTRSPAGRSDRAYIMFGMRIVGDFGVAIAAPVVILALAGKWLDGRYGTGRAFTVAGFILAFLLSAGVIWRKTKAFSREYQRLQDEEKKGKNEAPRP
jgi:hypothetical protein